MRVHGNHMMRWKLEIDRFCSQAGLGLWPNAAANADGRSSFEESFVHFLWTQFVLSP